MWLGAVLAAAGAVFLGFAVMLARFVDAVIEAFGGAPRGRD
jgi:hypothetical protein